VPYAKKTEVIMKILVYVLTFIPLLTFGQKDKTKLFESYSYSDGRFYYRLDLYKDSTFVYEHSFKFGSTMSNGNWLINNDTLVLSNYESPWTISNVEEKFIDSLNNTTVIEIKVNDTSSEKIRGDHILYIDGNPTSVKYDYSKSEYMVKDFDVWVNGDCQDVRKTSEKGIIQFEKDSILEISINYNEYQVQSIGNNYFVLTLSYFPILVSPPTLKWTKWKIQNNEIIPFECGQLMDYVKLKK
jgi:hypothetical protein